jgi:glutamate-ammonia-ligase adenylyltransferase
MVDDRQTHALPASPEGLARFAPFLGLPDTAALAAHLLPHLRAVHGHFEGLLASGLPQDGSAAAWDEAELADRLRALGFRNIEGAVRAITRWRDGYPRATRTERARALLREVLPALLAALARQAEPDTAFARFDSFLARLPAGVQILSLFQRNPALLDRVATVLGAAPMLADYMARDPSALEGLLAAGAEDPDRPPPWRTLGRQLREAAALEEAIAVLRRFVRGEEFRLSLALLEGRIDADRAGLWRTALAEATIRALLPRVLAAQAARHGTVPGGRMAVVALGKAGSREMLPGSDLDLMLIYDHPDAASESDGARPLPASTWFMRAAHGFIAALTAPGPEGPLYAIDMRLRPSGNKGPVAVPLGGFIRYHAAEAWTWERMALTRARVVAGPSPLRRRVRAAIGESLHHAGPPARVLAEAAAMRRRIARELPDAGPWDVKLRPGGLLEVEFIAQALQLVAAPDHPGLCHPTTRIAFTRLAEAGLLPRDEAARLIRADHVWRTVQGVLRLALRHPGRERLPPPVLATLGRAVGAGAGIDEAALRATLDDLAGAVRSAFLRHVGPVEEESDAGGG